MSKARVLHSLLALFAIPVLAGAGGDEGWDVTDIPGESREIAIDTTTGTWISVDVSPDGETIAFDLLGDIYTIPAEGGEATAVHDGFSWSMQPRFSPDGSEIAFISDAGGGDNIWIMGADGANARQLTTEDFRLLNNPYWSPDGEYLVARKHFTTTRSLGTGEIWLYHRDGGDGVAVIERPNELHQKELGEPAFSPDGRYVYFSVDSTPGWEFIYAQDSNSQIFEIRRHDLRTGETTSYVTGAGGAVRPTPSPDGKQLAFVRRIRGESALFVKNLESGAENAVYRNLEKDLQEVWGVHGLYPNMDWTPDSRRIVFWDDGRIKQVDIESGEVADIAFHVSDTRTVYRAPVPRIEVAPATFLTTMPRNAEVSPDGSKVVFESAGHLYVKALPDGEPRRLTRDGNDTFEYDPTWSRDGRQIAFVAWHDAELGSIRIVQASGGRSRTVTSRPGHYHAPRFFPGGEAIVYVAGRIGNLTSPDWNMESGVFVIGTRGGDARRILANGSNPHFGADPDRLFVTRPTPDGAGLELLSVDTNGEKPRVHATGEYLARYEVSPDGRTLAYRENFHIYAVPLPPGGKPLQLGTSVSSLSMTRASGDGGNFPSWSNGGERLHWTLGPTLFSAAVNRLFASGSSESYLPPEAGASLARELRADVPTATVLLENSTVITMADDTGGVIDNAAVLIEGNRIVAVGPKGSFPVPGDARRVDVSGKTIVPGLIDTHAHGAQAVGMIPQQNWKNHATLAFGVTTIFDPASEATDIFAVAEMQRTGQVLAPRIYSTGNTVYGGRSRSFAEIQSLGDARRHVRRLKAQGAISIKNYNQPRREQRQQVTTAAREENIHVVSEGGSLYHMDLSMVADGNSGIEHNIPQSRFYDDVLQFWGQTEVAYTPTLVVTYGGMRAEDYWYMKTNVWEHPILSNFVPPDVLQPRSVRRIKAPDSDFYHVTAAATARQLSDEGVPVSIGAHGQREGLASYWEMWGFAQGGMSPYEMLRTATTDAARKLGMQDDIGSIEPGKLADLVILDVNPFDDVYSMDQVNMVMLNGRLYEAATLNEVVTGDRRTEPFYWQQ